MGIMIVVFGPMVLAFLILAAVPPNTVYLGLLVLALGLAGAMALAPVPPASGPDDWYNGIGRAGGLLGLVGAAATIPAQAARRFVPLRPLAYIAALIVTVFVGFNLATLFPGV